MNRAVKNNGVLIGAYTKPDRKTPSLVARLSADSELITLLNFKSNDEATKFMDVLEAYSGITNSGITNSTKEG